MLTPKERGTQKVVEAMEELGYMTTFTCLNSLTYGLPQSRKRCYGVSAKLRSYGAAGKTTVAQQMNAVWAITKRLECGVVEPLTRLWEHRQTLTPDDSESICKTKAISKSGLPWCSGIVYRLWVSCVNTFFLFQIEGRANPQLLANMGNEMWSSWSANAEAAIDKLRSLIDPGLGPSGGSLMLPQTMQHESIGSTTPLHWRYSRDSVWSGVSEDWKILGTAKSIVAKGFLHLNFNNFVSWKMDFSYLVSDTLSVTMKKPVLA